MLLASSSQLYFPDTSALIAAWEERYPQDLFPSVWWFMDGLGDRLAVCEEVRTEVIRRAPDLMDWLGKSSIDSSLSLATLGENGSQEVQRHLRRISDGWPHWRPVRSGNGADPWVIAYARALDGVVVSEERPRVDRRGSVKIPEVCDELVLQRQFKEGCTRMPGGQLDVSRESG